MKRRNQIFERIVVGADLPGECLPGVPLVEIAGEGRVLVENHCGVTAYKHCEICIKVKYGQICVCGNDLELARMTKNQLVITGEISGVKLYRGQG